MGNVHHWMDEPSLLAFSTPFSVLVATRSCLAALGLQINKTSCFICWSTASWVWLFFFPFLPLCQAGGNTTERPDHLSFFFYLWRVIFYLLHLKRVSRLFVIADSDRCHLSLTLPLSGSSFKKNKKNK